MKNHHLRPVIATLLLSLLFAPAGFARGGEISAALAQRLKTQKHADVLVRLKDIADLSKAEQISDRTKRIQFVYDQLRRTAQKSQQSLQAYLTAKGVASRSLYIENTVVINDASMDLIHLLKERNDIKDIALDVRTSLNPIHPAPGLRLEQLGEPQSNIKDISAHRVWKELGVRGRGIVVAGQDSGFEWLHDSLKRQYRGFKGVTVDHDYNWHDAIHARGPKANRNVADACPPNSSEPCDDSSHGTHTMGTMVGDDGRDNAIGVAPEAKWIGCRNMKAGTGQASTYLECFEFFLAPFPRGGIAQVDGRPDLAPHIINNSWACPATEGCQGDEFINAVRALSAAGILVVAAAGNEGPGCGTVTNAPGSYSGELISVGGYNRWEDDIAYFSSRGPSAWHGGLAPMITAPGNLIRSAIPGGRPGKSEYDYKAGTSMASPHVAGAAALLWSARPELIGNIKETIALFQRSANPRTSGQSCGPFAGGTVPNAVYGYGLLDAFKLVTAK